jgi:hypothetical protein
MTIKEKEKINFNVISDIENFLPSDPLRNKVDIIFSNRDTAMNA